MTNAMDRLRDAFENGRRPPQEVLLPMLIDMLEADPNALDGAASMIPSDEEVFAAFPQLAAVTVTPLEIDGPHGAIPARTYRVDGSEPRAGFVWVHGGAFILGDLTMLESHWVAMSLAARDIPTVAIDYRKALGGVHYPVPSDDVVAAWRWVAANSDDVLGIPASRVHMGGGSAGANLTAGAAKRLRDDADPLPASLVLAYGVFHAALPEPSAELRAAIDAHPDPMLFPTQLRDVINLRYAGSEDTLTDPYAFPGNGELAGLPPCYLLDSEADLLRASAERFAGQLVSAGVDVRQEFEPGSTHGHLNEAFEPEATRSIERITAWISERTAP